MNTSSDQLGLEIEPPQIKSRENVRDRGEVFTSRKVVNEMLDLLPPEAFGLEVTYLEPACGEGVFLAEILRRKLERHALSETHVGLALSSLYGVDIDCVNVAVARQRIAYVVDRFFVSRGAMPSDSMLGAVQGILAANIVVGDFLKPETVTLCQWRGIGTPNPTQRFFRLSEGMRQTEAAALPQLELAL